MFVAGNWKMNTTCESAVELARALAQRFPQASDAVEILVCPPFPYLSAVRSATQGSAVELGAQNCYFEPPGAFTGEVAVDMLLDVGCEWVILGHSERRHVLGETDELINRKVTAALAKSLPVILCVGETLEERDAGRTEAVLDAQMDGGLKGIEAAGLKQLAIAYEPVWAIGTGKTATTEQADAAHAHLRNWLAHRYNADAAERMRILYGGSVKPDNARSLLEQPNVDGALVGGASLKAELFVPIVDAAIAVAG
jgi:triosephosphate isomerase